MASYEQWRVLWYFYSTMLQDEETQKKGCTVIGYNVGHGVLAKVDRDLYPGLAAVTAANPIRLAGLHLCYSNTVLGAVMGVILGVADPEVRVRTKLHQGTKCSDTLCASYSANSPTLSC